jgi:hypothetical protein
MFLALTLAAIFTLECVGDLFAEVDCDEGFGKFDAKAC